jgi:2-polyprenyl-3-methyl-5-hydroxy-6-metoxy-1,4-benzoquinol methylase
MVSPTDIRLFYEILLGRLPSTVDTDRASLQFADELGITFAQAVMSSAEYQRQYLDQALQFHLYLIHAARVKLVSRLLPPARMIVDIGGANGTLHDMGYPYDFEELIVVDLPPQERCEMYQNLKLESRKTERGPISILYTNMTDLSAIGGESIDMVWMGQAIEHVSEDDSFKVYRECSRILRPGGWLCLDTPNRLITKIHTTGLIHPEHKIEYAPEHLERNLTSYGFTITDKWGLCEMPQTARTGTFHYSDFALGSGVTKNIQDSYIQYYACKKAG